MNAKRKIEEKKDSPKKTKSARQKATCFFCEQGSLPDYKNVAELEKFLSDRGRILPRGRSGVCAKHQRRLTKAIKRARHLALLPFIVRPK